MVQLETIGKHPAVLFLQGGEMQEGDGLEDEEDYEENGEELEDNDDIDGKHVAMSRSQVMQTAAAWLRLSLSYGPVS